VVIFGLLLILIGIFFNIAGVGDSNIFSTPLIILGAVLFIGSALGLVVSYIVFEAPTENIWKNSSVYIPLGFILGGIVGYLISVWVDMSLGLPTNMNINFTLGGLLFGFCAAILFLRSPKYS